MLSPVICAHLKARATLSATGARPRSIAFLHGTHRNLTNGSTDSRNDDVLREGIARPIAIARILGQLTGTCAGHASDSTKAEDPLRQAHKLDRLTQLIHGDALEVMAAMPVQSVHAIVTDPPYGLIEYEAGNHEKLRQGKGGVWRIPPKLDGVERAPLPRFTVLGVADRERLVLFFKRFGELAMRILVPGGHMLIASNPLLSTAVFAALAESGLEKRGEIIRLVSTFALGGTDPRGRRRRILKSP